LDADDSDLSDADDSDLSDADDSDLSDLDDSDLSDLELRPTQLAWGGPRGGRALSLSKG